MKRLIALLLCLLLLTGCAGRTPASSVPSSTPAPAASSAPQEEPEPEPEGPPEGYVLLDSAQTEDGVLYHLTCEALENSSYSGILDFNGPLLLSCVQYDDMEQGTYHLAVMDPKDGSLTAETSMEIQGYCPPQVRGDEVILCDSNMGWVRHLNGALETVQELTAEPDWGYWYVGADTNFLYKLDWTSGATAVNLTSGAERNVSGSATEIFSSGQSGSEIYLSYVDSETLMNTVGVLDLSTGHIRSAPIDADLGQITHFGSTWLGQDFNEWYTYYLSTGDSCSVAQLGEGQSLRLLSEDRLLLVSYNSNTLALYDLNGTFLSQCVFSTDEDCYFSDSPVWSDAYGGYFLLISSESGGSELLFWDVNAPVQSGEDLALISLEEYQSVPAGNAVSQELYDRCAQIGETYGVTVLIADQCKTDFDSYITYQVTDEASISLALNALERVLSAYPEGFLAQLRFGHVRGIEISLTGGLTNANETLGDYSYAAFTQQVDDKYIMVMDVFQTNDANFYHEFSHIIDSRLAQDAYYCSDTLFSEETWISLSPEDGGYTYTYAEWPEIYGNGLDEYYIDNYSRTYPTEDRARVMEYAMMDWDWSFKTYPHIREKLDYYARCIRDSFDTTGWPEITPWEKPLQ